MHYSTIELIDCYRIRKSYKTLKGGFGELPIDISRDNEGSFQTVLAPLVD